MQGDCEAGKQINNGFAKHPGASHEFYVVVVHVINHNMEGFVSQLLLLKW